MLRVTALYLDTKPIALEREEPGGVEFLYRCFLMDPSGNEGFVVDLVEPPPRLERRTLVTAEAVFVKIGAYEGGKGPVYAPQLVGRELRLLKQKYEPTAFPLAGMLLSAALLSLVLLLVTFWLYRQARWKSLGQRHLAPRAQKKRSIPEGGESLVSRVKAPSSPPAPPKAPTGDGTSAPDFGIKPRPKIILRPRRASSPDRLPTKYPSTGQRWVFVAIAACAVLLAGMIAFNLYERLRGAGRVDLALEWEKALEGAQRAHADVLGIESKVWTKGDKLQPEDFERIRGALRALEEKSERMGEILEATYQKDRGGGLERTRELAPKLLEVKLWVLDGADLVDSEKDAAIPPGFYIPLHAAIDASQQAQKDLSSLEKRKKEIQGREADEKEKQGAEARLAEIQSALEKARGQLSKLEEYVKKGLARDDLTADQLPDLGLLRDAASDLSQAAGRAEELMRGFKP